MTRRGSVFAVAACVAVWVLTGGVSLLRAAVAVTVTGFNATGSACSGTTGPTFSITPSGSDRFLYLYSSRFDSSASATPTITVGGSGVTARNTVDINGGNFQLATAYLIAPAASALTVAVTYSDAVDGDCLIGAVAFSGVHQSSPLGTADVAGPQNSATCVNSPSGGDSNGMVLQVTNGNNGSLSWSHTNQWEREGLDGGNQSGGMQTTTGASATLTTTLGSSAANACIGEVIKEASAGGATPCLLSLLGVGKCE